MANAFIYIHIVRFKSPGSDELIMDSLAEVNFDTSRYYIYITARYNRLRFCVKTFDVEIMPNEFGVALYHATISSIGFPVRAAMRLMV